MESNGSLESKVESIYINNIQNNITVTQNIEGQRGNNCLSFGCCGVELEEDIESQNENSTPKGSKRSSSKKFTRGETCKCFNVGLTLAIFILTGMTMLMIPIFDFVDNTLKLPLFTAGLLTTVVSSILYCRYNQLVEKKRPHVNKPKLIVTDVDGRTITI